MEIGFIGLGAMGSGIAANLVKAGHQVSVWNRSPEPVEKLVRMGARRVVEPAQAFEGEAVFTMLADDPAMRSVILDGGVLEKARKGIVHVVMSTVSVGFAQELAERHRSAGIGYVAAPVLGRPDIAAAGELHVLTAGPEALVARLKPALDAFAKTHWYVGTEPYQANLVKLVANFVLASAIEAMAEAFALAQRHGVDPHRVHEVLTGTLFAAPAYKTYGPMLADRRYEPPLFKLPLGLKDIREAIAAGEMVGAPLPFASIVHDNLVDALGHGDGSKDWSAMAAVALRRAGLISGD